MEKMTSRRKLKKEARRTKRIELEISLGESSFERGVRNLSFVIPSLCFLGRGVYDSYTNTPTFSPRWTDLTGLLYGIALEYDKEYISTGKPWPFDVRKDPIFDAWITLPFLLGIFYGTGYLAGSLVKKLQGR